MVVITLQSHTAYYYYTYFIFNLFMSLYFAETLMLGFDVSVSIGFLRTKLLSVQKFSVFFLLLRPFISISTIFFFCAVLKMSFLQVFHFHYSDFLRTNYIDDNEQINNNNIALLTAKMKRQYIFNDNFKW